MSPLRIGSLLRSLRLPRVHLFCCFSLAGGSNQTVGSQLLVWSQITLVAAGRACGWWLSLTGRAFGGWEAVGSFSQLARASTNLLLLLLLLLLNLLPLLLPFRQPSSLIPSHNHCSSSLCPPPRSHIDSNFDAGNSFVAISKKYH